MKSEISPLPLLRSLSDAGASLALPQLDIDKMLGQNAEDLWTKYIQLTEAEAAFRALKSELAIPSSISSNGA